MTSIAAVVATHNRPELLAGRALASIAGQTRRPDYLIVVDDSDADFRCANAEVVSGLCIPDTRKIYLENLRTPGASGAWNTALFHLHRIDPSAYVAILDDDDSWVKTYLERCAQVIAEKDLDHGGCPGLVFHRFQDTASEVYHPPDSLEVSDLLVRKPSHPGVQPLRAAPPSSGGRWVRRNPHQHPPTGTSASVWPTWALFGIAG